MGNALHDRSLKSFFNNPTQARLRELQNSAFASPAFDPSAATVLTLEALLPTASPAQLITEISTLPRYLQLCPRLHFVEARIRENLGEIDEMRASVHRMQQCLRALMRTGDGTRTAPYRVTFTTDEHDILRVIGEAVRYQELVECGDRLCDVITSHAAIEVWFDVTQLLEIYARTAAPSREHVVSSDH